MYSKYKKNINKLLSNIEILEVREWFVENITDMEWEGEIRLHLNVVVSDKYYKDKYNFLSYRHPINASTEYYKYDISEKNFNARFKEKLIKIVKHYVSSFLGITIGDIVVVNLITNATARGTGYGSGIIHYDSGRYMYYDEQVTDVNNYEYRPYRGNYFRTYRNTY